MQSLLSRIWYAVSGHFNCNGFFSLYICTKNSGYSVPEGLTVETHEVLKLVWLSEAEVRLRGI